MSKGICIPPEVSNLIKNNIPARAMKSLAGMNQENQAEYINGIVGAFDVDDSTKDLLRQGLEREVLNTQKEMLKRMVKGKKVTDSVKQTLSDKIDAIDRLNGFDDNFISEVVEAKLGARISPEDAKAISNAVKKLQPLLDKDGNPRMKDGKYTAEFGEAIKEYKDAIRKANPSSFGDQFVSTGNANLLLNAKSSITNIVSNTSFGLIASAERTAEFGTPFRMDRAFNEAIEDANFFARYGYDVTRAENIDENLRSLGETVVQFGDRNAAEKLAGQMNELVYQKLLSTPDQFYASLAKRDTTYRLARNKVLEINPDLKVGSERFEALWDTMVEDAMKPMPQTIDGIEIRAAAVAEANRVTFQDESTLSKISVNLRRTIDNGAKEVLMRAGLPEDKASAFKLGTFIVPFAMTPANVINVGLDYTGVKVPFRLPKAINRAIKSANSGKEAAGIMLDFVRDTKITRPAVAFATAFGIASLIPPEDYIGLYPQNNRERELLEMKQAATNSVRVNIGGRDRWVSLDYLGPVGATLVAVMEMKKNSQAPVGEIALTGMLAAGRQLTQFPVVEGFGDAISRLQDTFDDGVTGAELYEEFATGLMNFVYSRSVPSIAIDVSESTDTVVRDTKSGVYTVAGINLDPIVADIPVIRENLDARIDGFGRKVEGQGINEILFGSRVKKSAESNEVIEIMDDFLEQGYQVAPTDYINDKVKEYDIPREQVENIKVEYGEGLLEAYRKTLNSPTFATKPIEEQADDLLNAEGSYKTQFRKTRLDVDFNKLTGDENDSE